MSTIRRYLAVLPCAVLLCANWGDTPRGIDLHQLQPFPLAAIRHGLLQNGQSTRFDELVALAHPGEVILRGKAESGKTWSAQFGVVAFDRVYRADLDGNGTQDYVIYGVCPFCNGRTAPDHLVTLLLMDSEGLPTPFEATLYDTSPEPRVLFDLLHDGRAQLLLSSYDERMWDGRVEGSCSGHWVNQLLTPKDQRWEEIRGNAAGLNFPLVHRWSYWPKCPLETRRRVKENIYMPERSTAASDISAAVITSVESDAVETSFRITPSPGCVDFRVHTVVYDRPADRRIGLYNPISELRANLLRQMKKDGTQIRLYGVKRDADQHCRANMLWGDK